MVNHVDIEFLLKILRMSFLLKSQTQLNVTFEKSNQQQRNKPEEPETFQQQN
ncbi:protein of unknown function [Shewanella benthica]|uniref:Uncharacterized protein n=1 Tax=Shewanella benthica TaxID=43661 RepID=A0A330M6K9_9GAMM|nr:protein of unknown function [Shewanella benthica]